MQPVPALRIVMTLRLFFFMGYPIPELEEYHEHAKP